MNGFIVTLGVIGVLLFGWLLGFGIFSGVVWLVCWSFDLTFTWKYAFGAWLIWMLASGIFRVSVTNKTTCDDEYSRWGK